MTGKKKLGLPAKMGIGLAAGVVFGLIIDWAGWDTEFIKPLGDLFIRLIRMVVVPLVFASLVAGAASVGNAKKLGSVAGVYICESAPRRDSISSWCRSCPGYGSDKFKRNW